MNTLNFDLFLYDFLCWIFVVYDKIFYTKSHIPTEKAEQRHVSWLYSYKYKLHVSQIFIEYDINLWAYNTFKFNGVVNGVLFSTVFARIWTWFWKSDFFKKTTMWMFRLQVQNLMLEYKPNDHVRAKIARFSARWL